MCGIIGYVSTREGSDAIKYVLPLIEESSIRGLHGTGISFIKDGRVCTLKFAKPYQEVKSILEKVVQLNPVALIAHVRYSTSHLEYPQPISSESVSIVHNGVISQEDPSTWESTYNLTNFSTKNDSEILFKILENSIDDHGFEIGNAVFGRLPKASIACCCLTPKALIFFRNGKRPLWYAETKEATYVASTCNIIQRSGLCQSLSNLYKAEMNHVYVRSYIDYSRYEYSWKPLTSLHFPRNLYVPSLFDLQ